LRKYSRKRRTDEVAPLYKKSAEESGVEDGGQGSSPSVIDTDLLKVNDTELLWKDRCHDMNDTEQKSNVDSSNGECLQQQHWQV
jgi:hypothetical protein